MEAGRCEAAANKILTQNLAHQPATMVDFGKTQKEEIDSKYINVLNL